MMQIRFAFCLLAALLTAAACPSNGDNGDPVPAPEGNQAIVYTTNTSGLRFQESHVAVEAAANDPFYLLHLAVANKGNYRTEACCSVRLCAEFCQGFLSVVGGIARLSRPARCTYAGQVA